MPSSYEAKRAELRRAALEYHEFPTPGKVAIAATKQLLNQRDLALAYSPGVAAACEEIAADPVTAYRFTARGNLVAVVTNGTAVLGLGDIGPAAGKPVMEGKACLFKKFADIDVFDLEIEHIEVGELLEEIPFPLHDRLAGDRADVAEAEHRGAVGDDGDEVAFGGVRVRQVLVALDLEARLGDTR